MFTVKATYHSITRKFTFQEDTFPTYEQLASQLYKAFSVTSAYYLSHILLSPNSNVPNSRILIGKEVHDASEYQKRTKSYQGRSWPGAVLRFAVYDEESQSDTITPEHSSMGLEDDGLKVGSYRWSATTSTAINTLEGSDVSEMPDPDPDPGRSSAAEERQSHRAQIENERRIILDRIRERTFTRSSTGPAMPNASSSTPAPNFMDTIPTMPITLRDLFKTPDATVNNNRDQSPDLNAGRSSEEPARKTDLVTRLSESTRERLSARSQATSPVSVPPASSSTYGAWSAPVVTETGPLTLGSLLAQRRPPANASTPLAANRSRLQRLQCALSSRTASESACLSHAGSTFGKQAAPSENGEDSDDLVESEQEQSDATDDNSRRCRHSYDWGACVYPHCISNLKPASGTHAYSRIADSSVPSPSSWSPPLPVNQALSAIRSGLSFLSESAAASPVSTDVTMYGGFTPVPSAAVGDISNRHTFEEASERVVDLGLDVLRRASNSRASTAQSSPMPTLKTVNDTDSEGAGSVASLDDDLHFAHTSEWLSGKTHTWLDDKIVENSRRTWEPPSMSAHGHGFASSSRRPLPMLPEVPRLATWRRRNFRNATATAGPRFPDMPAIRTPSPVSPPAWSDDLCGWRSPRSSYTAAASPGCRSRSLSRDLSTEPPTPWSIRISTPTPPPAVPTATPRAFMPSPVPVAMPTCYRGPPPPLPPPPVPLPVVPPPPVLYPFSSNSIGVPPPRPPQTSYSWDYYTGSTAPAVPPQPPSSSFQSAMVAGAAPHDCGWTAECERLKKQIEDVRVSLETLRLDFNHSAIATERSTSSPQEASTQEKGKERASNVGYHHASLFVGMPGANIGLVQTRSLADRAKEVNNGVQAKIDQWNNPTNPTAVLPATYRCDGCNQPIFGVAHRCLDCEDFEFCESCIALPRHRDSHDFKHVFYPIPCGDEDVAFIAARARKQGVQHHATCDGCQRSLFGVRHRCLLCEDFDFCEKCISTVNIRSQHDMDHPFFPIEVPWDRDGFELAQYCHRIANPAPTLHTDIICNGCNMTVAGVRHKCLVCEDFDFCPSCVADPNKRFAHDLSHAFLPVPKPGDLENLLAARTVPNEPEPLVIHENVSCDNCREVVIGCRHKCLDCPDFDLCEMCVSHGAKDTHNAAHQFVELATPGRVIVHRVYEEPQEPVLAQETEPVVHSALCNLCESRIRGIRYKCLTCPDFDICSSCFSIVPEEHPQHAFVKIADENQIILPNSQQRKDTHPATCDECKRTIKGIRYKCLHPDCLDFDLCQACEALPIPVHPAKHTLAKLRIKGAYFPTSRDCTNEMGQDAKTSESVLTRPTDISPVIPQRPFTGAMGVESRTPSGSEANIATSEVVCDLPRSPYMSRVSSALDYADPIPSIPPLIPASWTPPEIDWRWRSPPPGPMVVPHMLSDEPAALGTQEPSADTHCGSMAGGADQSEFSPPELNSSFSLPVSPPETPLVDIDVPLASHRASPVKTHVDSNLPFVTISSHIPGALDIDGPSQPIPRFDSDEGEWHQFWPEVTSVLKHLLHPPSSVSEPSVVMPGALSVNEEPKQEAETDQRTVIESPLAAEALLSRPAVEESPEMVERPRAYNRRLSDYLTVSSPSSSPVLPYSLQVSCLQSNNIPDGQQFPPGAEFVKSWRMQNDGQVPWPEETALVFVAGERLATHEGAVNRVHVGKVYPGEEIEMVCAEMKAPDVPAKYVSYWRLHDGRRYFGDSVWVDIAVVESNEDSMEESLAASSVIMPPAPSLTIDIDTSARSSMPASASAPSGPLSDDGSLDSSISLVDVPSSPSISDDEEIYHDSRSAAPTGASHDVEYVVLYDTSSEDD